MPPPNVPCRPHEVERRAHHAARSGFRIAEMQIDPTQTIPWHYHTKFRTRTTSSSERYVFLRESPTKRSA